MSIQQTDGDGARKRVVSWFKKDLNRRAVAFIKSKEVVTSMASLLELSVEFYLASYERSEKVVRSRFPARSAGEEPETIIPTARDGPSRGHPSKKHA